MSRSTIALMILSEGVGGAEAVVKQIARHMDASRHDYLLVTNDEIQDYYRDTGMRLVSLGAIYRRSWLTQANRLLAKMGCSYPITLARLNGARNRLLDIIRKHQVGLIHSHLIPDHYLSSQLPADGIVRLMTMHGGLNLDVTHRYLLDKKRVLGVMNEASYFTSACRYFLDLLQNNGVDVQGRSAIIENGIHIDTSSKTNPPAPAKPDGVLKMVFLGGDRPLKGGDLLARALKIVVRDRHQTNVRLTVLREVHRRSEMYRRIQADGLQDFVDFVGYVPNRGHLRYIEAADLFVQPSRSEGVANALMEAIGLGKAVLATDVGGTREVVSHEVNGFLCRPDPESIADGIGYFLKNAGALGRFANKNLEWRSRFLWPTLVGKYEDLYERLLVRG
jgi:glycosyltransferase involved in cell wall biosynthesis